MLLIDNIKKQLNDYIISVFKDCNEVAFNSYYKNYDPIIVAKFHKDKFQNYMLAGIVIENEMVKVYYINDDLSIFSFNTIEDLIQVVKVIEKY